MDSTAPTATTLYNYDVDREPQPEPGLGIKFGRKGGDFEEGTSNKFQNWTSEVFTDTATIDGRASLYIHLAADQFATSDLVILGAYLYDYDPGSASESLVIQRAITSINSTAGWTEVAIHFRPTVYTLVPGHQLRLELQIDGDSTADGMVAYDTTTYQALLMVPFTPAGLDFTDILAGGTTSGTILEFGAHQIAVVDLAEPAGFRFTATGSSSGTGIINACDGTFLLSAGDILDITCGSIIASVLAGEVELYLLGGGANILGATATARSVAQAEILLSSGSVTKVSEVTDTGFVLTQDPLSDASVTVDVLSSSSGYLITAPRSSTIRIEISLVGDVTLVQEPGSTAPIAVEIAGEVIVIPPGQVLPDGLMGIKELALEKLEPYRGESAHIVSAINKINDSLATSYWETRSTLGTKYGHKVFSREKNAVQQLAEALEEDNLSIAAATTTLQVIDDLVNVDRKLAADALQLSLDTPTLNPKRAKKAGKLQNDAQRELDEGDQDRDADRGDHAIDHYRQAWENAIEALDQQADPTGGIDDEDDDEEKDDKGKDDDKGKGK